MSGNRLASPPPRTWPDTSCPTYRQAYGRINALVSVGEGLADRHFRLLATAAVLAAEFVVLFQEALRRIGFDPAGARRLLAGALVQG